ncbi:pyrroline-5-carboxylate reductase [Peribacillus cavernae]|uniref:Pyrroline-5-carboxylate reductase n=1 Tax=Peribacillus cavernae TaxID=1674310 RepID=A0A433HE11_9BACI|nr:pyrroline-5-carboxylate reductase [Peribacillus cavernae]MDQ0219078.1 pyrroline-5-carboxylate reductase [Peribacillus cavernae]RUQ26529.1 pyrroline-5-carboxylate reductase [Peribacillus cavernae]
MGKIAFIGAGSMAEAIISGLITRGVTKPEEIHITNRSDEKRLAYLQNNYGVTVCSSIETLLEGAEIVVLAVKPKDVLAAVDAVKAHVTEHMLLISVAAGVQILSLEEILTKKIPIIRAMPNTSAAVGKSATALAINQYTQQDDLKLARQLFETIGSVAIVAEEQLDAVTGLSGSGPAYIYYLVEAMEKSSEKIGLDGETAKQLIIQTLIGAAEMLSNSDKTPAVLRKEVTSPGGTTEAGIKVLEAHGVQEALISCIQEAAEQSKRMGLQISQELTETLLHRNA